MLSYNASDRWFLRLQNAAFARHLVDEQDVVHRSAVEQLYTDTSVWTSSSSALRLVIVIAFPFAIVYDLPLPMLLPTPCPQLRQLAARRPTAASRRRSEAGESIHHPLLSFIRRGHSCTDCTWLHFDVQPSLCVILPRRYTYY